MKTCTLCGEEKANEAFGWDRSRSDKRFPWCSVCKSNSRRQRYNAEHPDAKGNRAIVPESTMVYKFKFCIDCGEQKPISQFHRKRTSSDGRHSYCFPCGSARSSKWESENKERAQSRRLAWRRKSPRQSLNVSLLTALRRRPCENPATLDDLMGIWEQQGGRCLLSGVKLTWATGKVEPTSITLDRKDPFGGYTAENIRLLSYAVNTFRGRMSDPEMLTMAKAIVAHMEPSEASEYATGALSLAA